MIVPDVNLLIYAYDELAPLHNSARQWWEETLSDSAAVGIPSIVLLAFVRLSTHPAIVQTPITIEQAEKIVISWLAVDRVRILSPSNDTFTLLFALLKNAGTGGNLTTDGLIAALATEFGGIVYSTDRDFDRFPDVVWRNPLSSRSLLK